MKIGALRGLTVVLIWMGGMVAAHAQQSIFYELKGSNIKTCYILGVIPSEDPNIFNLSDSVYWALSQSEVLGTEALIDSQEIETLQEAMRVEPGNEWREELNNTQFGLVDEQFQRYVGQSLWKWTNFEPFYLLHVLSKNREAKSPGRTLPSFLRQIGELQQKQVKGIFLPSDLTTLYGGIREDIQRDLLVQYATMLKSGPGWLQRLTNQYLTAEMTELSKLVKTIFPYEYDVSYLTPKTQLLLRRIPTMARRQSTFFMVDATVLGGEAGLLKGLQSEGYKVRPIGFGFDYIVNNDGTITGMVAQSDTMIFEEGGTIRYYNLNEEFEEAYFNDVIPNWYPLTSFRGSFSVRMPARPEIEEEWVPAGNGQVKLHIYQFEDRALNLFYLVSYYDYPPEAHVGQEQTFFKDLISRTVSKFNGILLLERDISTDQFKGREIEVSVNNETTIRARFYLVGDRIYQVTLGATGQKAYSKQNEAFLRSFRILDQRHKRWFDLTTGVGSLEIPNEPTPGKSSLEFGGLTFPTVQYSLTDDQTNLNYFVSVATCPDDFKLRKTDGLYRKMVQSTAKQTGSVLINETEKDYGKAEGRYAEFGATDNTVTRILVLYVNHRLVQLLVQGPEDSAFSELADRFFDTYEVPGWLY